MEMIPGLRGTVEGRVRKSKTYAQRKQGEGLVGEEGEGGNLSLGYIFFSFLFFKRRLSSFCFMTSKSPPQPVRHISHLLQNSLNIKRPAYQFCLVRSLTY